MTLAWMFYALIVSLCFALAASAAEWVLRAFRRPARGVWVLAMVATSLVPMMAFLPQPDGETEPMVAVGTPPAMSESVVAAFKWTAAKGTQVNATVLFFWGSTSVLLLGMFAWSAARITREQRRWRAADVAGHSVLVSRTTGPAIVGVGRSTIVIPEWVLDLEHDLQRLIVRHEEEHRRARDLWLGVGAIVAIVVFPWNLAMWWQARRLRLAIEIDCDRRVLEKGASIKAYAGLLLTSAEHRLGRLEPAGMALAESTTSLERRIDDMTRTKVRSRGTRSLGHALAALALVIVACDTPMPEAPLLSEGSADRHRQDKLEATWVVRDSTKIRLHVKLRPEESSDPLYVVDGVIMEKTEIDVDKLDIEAIEVVKGKAAEALYGLQGANGVVHIRTWTWAAEPTLKPVHRRAKSDSSN